MGMLPTRIRIANEADIGRGDTLHGLSTGFTVDIYWLDSRLLAIRADVSWLDVFDDLGGRAEMARPRQLHPTQGELEVLQILWERGPSTVREVLEVLPKERAYTSVMSLLHVMFEKGLVTREPEGRAFRYVAQHQPDHTEGTLLSDLLQRVFSGSATAMVARLLEQAQPSEEELAEIRKLITQHKRAKK